LKRTEHLKDFFAKYWWRYVLGILTLIIVDALQLVVPKILGNVTDALREGSLTPEGLKKHVLIILAIACGIAIGRFLWRIFIMGTARLLDFELRNKLFAHLQKLPARYYTEHKTGELMAHATNDIPSVRQAFGQGFILITDSIFMTTATLIILFRTVPLRLAVFALLPFPLLAVSTAAFSKIINPRHLAVHEAFGELSDRAQESIAGIRVTKSFVQEDAEIAKFMAVAQKNVDANIDLVKIWGLMSPLSGLATALAYAVVLRYGSSMIMYQQISLGDFVAFTSYLAMLVWPMIALGWVINVMERGFTALDRLNAVLNEVPEVADEPGAIELEDVTGTIEFRNLTFSYRDGVPPALSDISFKIDAGKTLAVVGRTGSGKTTIVNLLTRLYNPPEGSVFIDGHDIRNVTLSSLRNQIGCVPQDTFLFSCTIGENIAFADRDFSPEEICHYAKIAHVYDDIMGFPEGFDTKVGERGVTLSGGQKQRISIARALITEPKILILDDSLSAVDTQTEESILRGLSEFMHDRTSIIISHRISTVRDADEIIVLDDGKIIERGTHASLLAQAGLYSEIYEKQLLEEELASRS